MRSLNTTHGFAKTIKTRLPAAPATIESDEMMFEGWMILIPAGHEGFNAEGVKIACNVTTTRNTTVAAYLASK